MANTNRKSKKMSDAKCIKTRQVYPQDTNHHHTMFGGTLMANIDEIAAITAMKHAGNPVVTASTDSVDFLRPITTGDILSYEAMVSYAGTSSMEICVQIVIDDDFDYIIAMDQSNVDNIKQINPNLQGQLFKLLEFSNMEESDVPDPYYTNNFEGVFEMVQSSCDNLIDYIVKDANLKER